MDSEAQDQASQPSPEGIKSSIHTLVSSRISLFCLEVKQALRERCRAITFLVTAALLGFFSWALLLAGSIAAIAIATGWQWHLVALCFAALHLMAAVILVKAAAAAAKSDFIPITRSEFKKDCEWLESLKNKPKSKS